MAAAIGSKTMAPASAPASPATPVDDGYFPRHSPIVCGELVNLPAMPYSPFIASMIVTYVTSKEDCFGAEAYRKYYGVDIEDAEPLLEPYEFYRFWFGLDPFNPAEQVCKTHLPPVLRPRVIKRIDAQTSCHFSLNAWGELMQSSLGGSPSQYARPNSQALLQNGKTKAEPAAWLSMRKGVVARHKPWPMQRRIVTEAGYKIPSAIDVVTVVETRRKATGERHLGDETGAEKRWTYARCGETATEVGVVRQVVVGGHAPLAVGGGAPGGLYVEVCHFDDPIAGVAALQQFSGYIVN